MSDREQELLVQRELPTSVTAMRYAVELAANTLGTALDLDRARTWVVIASELRAGEIASLSVKGVELSFDPADNFGETYGGEPAYAGETASTRFYAKPQMDETVTFRPGGPDETQIIHTSAGGAECGNCGHAISLYLPGPGTITDTPTWMHNLTGQTVCPVSAPDKAHTFATPKADSRG
jgi:hypothetical protein